MPVANCHERSTHDAEPHSHSSEKGRASDGNPIQHKFDGHAKPKQNSEDDTGASASDFHTKFRREGAGEVLHMKRVKLSAVAPRSRRRRKVAKLEAEARLNRCILSGITPFWRWLLWL
jgi:hypothetical protein